MVAKTPVNSFALLLLFFIILLIGQQQHQHQLPVVSAASTTINKQSGPRIEISPTIPLIQINAKYPDMVPSCKAVGADPKLFSTLKWSGPNDRNNAEQLKAKHQVWEQRKNSNIWNLKFKSPKPDDSGEYFCSGTFQDNDPINASIQVLIQNPLEVSGCSEKQFVTRGDTNGKIYCQISGDSPSVDIFKDNQPIDGSRYLWDNENNGISIYGTVNSMDAGLYTISVRSQMTGQTLEQRIFVDVNSKPEFLPNDISQFHGIEGEQVQLECKVTGNPKPLVYWIDPKKRNLTSVGGYIVTPERGTLLIHRVDRQWDQGQFECHAFNNVGSEFKNVTMFVDTRPTIVNFDNKTVEEGAEVTFECRSTGEPEPKFSIRRHGINQLPYMNGDGLFRREEVIVEEGGSNVYIHRLTVIANRSHYGLHYCNATNRAGSAERYNHLFVKYKPDLSSTSTVQYVRMGKTIVVNCQIKAYPPPEVTWWSDRTQIINVDSTFETSPDNQVHNIKMTPPSQQQVAFNTFTCRAKNDMGESTVQIKAQYTTTPGIVSALLAKRTSTTVDLALTITNDGGDRIRKFVYTLEGRTLDDHNPLYSYRRDIKPDTELVASLRDTDTYTIKNLLPYYTYKMQIRAVNDVGEGQVTEAHFDTMKPTRPDPPIIIKPDNAQAQHSNPGYRSEYSNGYELIWSPPEFDNGDVITKYIIKYYAYDSATLDLISDQGQERMIEQMNDRPMRASLGPLEPGRRYRVELRAVNKYGASDPANIVVFTKPGGQPMPKFESRALTWISEPSTLTLIAMLLIAAVLAIIIDLIFCFTCQMGLSYKIRYWCCPPKETSVIGDKPTLEQ